MDDGERNDLVAEVADALTLDQDVDWDRCRRQATPANRRSLDNLRLVAGVFSGSEAAEGASPASATTNLQPFAGVFVRRAMQALMAFAAFEVAAALLLFLWGWGDIYREYGAYAVQLAFLLVGYSVTAGLFLFGGRRDRRTWLLGAYFLLKATMVNPFVFLGLLRGVPPTEPFGYPNFGYPYVYPFLFAPACLWAFARECPRVYRRTWLDDLARRMGRGQPGGRLRPVGCERGGAGTHAGGLRGPRAFLVGLRRAPRHLDSVGAGGCRGGGGAARAHGPGRKRPDASRSSAPGS